MDTDIPVKVLEQCENGLQAAAGEALTAGDYGRARQIMAWAENIASMVMVAKSQAAAEKGAPWKTNPDALEAGSSVRVAGKSAMPFPPRGGAGGDEYPRFMRRGDELVKIAWSKSDRAEYQHRAPRRAVDAVVARLNNLAMNPAGAFGSEDLNPLKDLKTGGVFPTYQIFVALAWLRKLGLVKQEGRKSGYTMTRTQSLDEVVAAAWGKLPVWPS